MKALIAILVMTLTGIASGESLYRQEYNHLIALGRPTWEARARAIVITKHALGYKITVAEWQAYEKCFRKETEQKKKSRPLVTKPTVPIHKNRVMGGSLQSSSKLGQKRLIDNRK